MKLAIFFILGILTGIMFCVRYVHRNYSLYKNEPPLMVFVRETMESIKSREYLCPLCDNPLSIKLYPQVFDINCNGDCNQIGFGYFGSTNGSDDICPKCKSRIEWPPTHNWYSYKVQGVNNCNKIIKQQQLNSDIDWERWLKNEHLL